MVKNLTKYVPKKILSYLYGKLLGDANLTIEHGKQPRFRFQHTYSDQVWCKHCFDILNPYLPLNSPKNKKVIDPRLVKGYSESVYVQSKTHPLFTILKNIWYQDRKKIIPFGSLDYLLTPATLSWWYQDDGHLTIRNNKPKKIILSTDNFSSKENGKLIDLLNKKFHLNFSLDGQNRLCLYDQPQIYIFLHIVCSHMHISMNRKTWIHEKTLFIPSSKRTTIYLPSQYDIQFPTKQIKCIINRLDIEKFISDWFNSIYPIFLNKSIDSETVKGYQIVLNPEELFKLFYIQQKTGLRISDIINITSQNLQGK